MRLPRMTTRRWMVAVAVVGVTMGGFVAIRAVWQYFLALHLIQYHKGMEVMWRWIDPTGRDETQAIDHTLGMIDEQRRSTGDARLHEDMRTAIGEYLRIVAALHRKVEYHAAMARKYRRPYVCTVRASATQRAAPLVTRQSTSRGSMRNESVVSLAVRVTDRFAARISSRYSAPPHGKFLRCLPSTGTSRAL